MEEIKVCPKCGSSVTSSRTKNKAGIWETIYFCKADGEGRKASRCQWYMVGVEVKDDKEGQC